MGLRRRFYSRGTSPEGTEGSDFFLKKREKGPEREGIGVE